MSAPYDIARLLEAAMVASPASGAVMSHEAPKAMYRYVLWRVFRNHHAPRLLFVAMLNPSEANHRKNDRTMLSVLRLAKHLGYDGVVVTNLFAFRTSKPAVMKKAERPTGRHNDHWIDAAAALCDTHVAAWGANGSLQGRNRAVAERLSATYDLYAFRLISGGEPEHPLYIPTDITLSLYRPMAA